MTTTETGPRVLVVDDERAIRRFLRVSLTAHGYIVHEAGSGEEALTEVMAQRPDVAGPGIGLQPRPRRRRQRLQRHVVAPRVDRDEMLGQRRNVVAPPPQRH